MNGTLRVHAHPEKPLLIYDGDCGFCRKWIIRWQRTTGNAVNYIASQNPIIGQVFPEIPRSEFEKSVQLIEPDGVVYQGAEAVFRSLSAKKRWLLACYYKIPGAQSFAEWCYRVVAEHRSMFSRVFS